MASQSRIQLENWLKTIDVRANRLLDIGGSQNPVKGRTKSWEVEECEVLDLEVPHETKVKPDVICDLNKSFIFESIYDVAFCLEVAEYWWNPVQAMKNINLLLKKGGIFYFSAHFIYPIHNPLGEDCMRYTEFGVRKLLKETGFEIEDLQYRMAEELVPMVLYQAEQMRPSKEYSNHNATGYLVKAKKI